MDPVMRRRATSCASRCAITPAVQETVLAEAVETGASRICCGGDHRERQPVHGVRRAPGERKVYSIMSHVLGNVDANGAER